MEQQLIDNLTQALTNIINDEATLQAAIAAVQSVVTTPTAPTVDPVVTAVVTALESEGYTVTAPADSTTDTPDTTDSGATDDQDMADPGSGVQTSGDLS